MSERGQSQFHSILESMLPTLVGVVVAMTITQWITDLPIQTNLKLTCILTSTSMLLKYVFRRIFDYWYKQENKTNEHQSDI